MQVLLPLFLFTLQASSLFIALPLYLYPDTDASAWSSVFAAITAYPQIQWQAIINPNSGPGTVDSQSYPTDSNYITGIAELNSYSNVITLGYIHTSRGTRAYSDITTEIDIYAKWASYSGANISIHGIFFDEVANEPSSDTLTYYHNASTYVHAEFPSSVSKVMFNPGTNASEVLFDYCDTMWEFESPLSSYKNETTLQTLPNGYQAQSGIMINDVSTFSEVGGLVHAMALDGVGAVYMSNDCCYKVYDATLLQDLAAAVVAG